MDAGFHGAERQVERFGDLVVGQIVLVPQQYDHPVVVRQRIDETPDPHLLLGPAGQLVGPRRRILELDRVFLAAGAGLALRGRDRAHPAAAQVVDAQARGDGHEPCREGARRIVSFDSPEHADESLLGQVLGVLGAPRHAPGQGEHLPLVALHQLAVGPLVTRQAPAQEIGIGAAFHA